MISTQKQERIGSDCLTPPDEIWRWSGFTQPIKPTRPDYVSSTPDYQITQITQITQYYQITRFPTNVKYSAT